MFASDNADDLAAWELGELDKDAVNASCGGMDEDGVFGFGVMGQPT